jgi:hypothetical protein
MLIWEEIQAISEMERIKVFWNSLKQGEYVHYQDSCFDKPYGRWVRCIVSERKTLIPLVFLGKFPNNYWQACIEEANDWQPHPSTIWEASKIMQEEYPTLDGLSTPRRHLIKPLWKSIKMSSKRRRMIKT